jgi:uncharacterized protein (DUF697 family)
MADHPNGSSTSTPSSAEPGLSAKPEAIAAQAEPTPDKEPKSAEEANPTSSTKQSSSLWSAVSHNLHSFSDAVNHRATQVSKAARSTATELGDAIAHTTQQAGKVAAELGEATAKQTQHLLAQATQGTAPAIALVSNYSVPRKVGSRLDWNWFLRASESVDLAKAAETVQALHTRYPNQSPNQIAHLLMLQKAGCVKGVAVAKNLIPEVATALLTVDLSTNLAFQAEMLYQIAAAYGLDLQDPARKDEVLAIFGLVLGGNQAAKLGLGLLRTTPIAGALVGASANAAMLYSLGYAACQFYEAKLNEAISDTKLSVAKRVSRNYLQVAIAQQAMMDQILVHVILAGTDKRSWDAILPTLKALNLHPSTLKTIAENLKAPKPLYLLLNQLNSDFAVPLFTQARKIATRNKSITPQEAKILETIAEKFENELATDEA